MTKKDRWIPNRFYTQIQGGPASDALLCVLLEFRVGGILEGMQLESVTDSPTIPNMGGMVIAFRRSDGAQFAINTSDALTVWDDEDAWHAETDIDMICARLQEELARMVTSIPLNRATPLQPFVDNPATKEPLLG